MPINRIFLGIWLLYNVFGFAVQQRESVICMHTAPSSFPHPTPPGHHRAPSWAPCATQQFPASYAFYTWESIYSCLGNPMDRGAWWAADHGVTKSRTRLTWHSSNRVFISMLYASTSHSQGHTTIRHNEAYLSLLIHSFSVTSMVKSKILTFRALDTMVPTLLP